MISSLGLFFCLWLGVSTFCAALGWGPLYPVNVVLILLDLFERYVKESKKVFTYSIQLLLHQRLHLDKGKFVKSRSALWNHRQCRSRKFKMIIQIQYYSYCTHVNLLYTCCFIYLYVLCALTTDEGLSS